MKFKEEIIKLNISNSEDRSKIIQALANSGYPCWVEEERDKYNLASWNYFIVFNTNQKRIVDD